MQRRTLLRYGGTALTGATIGIGGTLHAFTNGASASVSMQSLSIDGATAATTDGTISGVSLSVSGSWSYDVPSGKQPETWRVSLYVTDGENSEQIAQTGGAAKYLNNNDEYSLQGIVTDTALFDAAAFRATPDGATVATNVGVRVEFVVVNASGGVIAAATHEDAGDVTVTNEAYNATEFGSVGGTGSFTVTE